MLISPIKFSQTLALSQNQINKELKKESKEKTSPQNFVNFPKAYGATNIAFCGKKNKKTFLHNHTKKQDGVKFEEMLELYKKREAEAKIDVPFFSPYCNDVTKTINYMCLNEPCLVFYTDGLDSRELFLHDLRFAIDSSNNRVGKYGLLRNTPFVHINLADYVENPCDAISDITKNINLQKKNGKKAIVIADNADSLLNVIERPYDFLNSSIFKQNPTIFLAEEKFRTLSEEENDILHASKMSYKKRKDEYKDLYFSNIDAQKIISKYKTLENGNIVMLKPVTKDEALSYLEDKTVQKYILAQGNDVEFEPGTIDYALTLATALVNNRQNYYGTSVEDKILNDKAQAVDLAIKLLRNGVASSEIYGNPHVLMSNIQLILPDGVDFDGIVKDYLELLDIAEQIEKSSKMNKQKTKTEKASTSEKEIKPQTPEATAAAKSIADILSSKNSKFEVIRSPKIKFSDVGGMYNVKRQLKEQLLDVLNNPNISNSQKPNGILLYGPPGSGKTLLATAIAGEAGVPFISTSGSSFVEIYVGTGAKAVRELYDQARKEARAHKSKTAIIFIDEAEGATGNRKNDKTGEDLKTVNAILHEMDGAKTKEESDIKIITIFATNHEGMIDSAIKRSGRVDMSFMIDDPRYSERARKEIAKIHAKKLKFKNSHEKTKLISDLAHNTMGMSGADIAQILKNAHLTSLRVGHPEYITGEDLRQAKLQIIAGVKTDIESSDYEVMQALDHEFGHAVNSMVLEKIFEGEKNKHKMPLKVLDFITSEARDNKIGATYFKPSYDNRTMSKETFVSDLIMLYGGSAAETKMFTTHSEKVKDDYVSAGEALLKAITEYDFGTRKHYMALTSDYAKSIWSGEIKEEMDNFAQKCMSVSKEIIDFAQPFIEEYIHSLLSGKGEKEEKIIKADEFKSKFSNWLVKSGKQEDFNALCKKIKSQIEEFCSEEQKRGKLGF